MKRIRVARRRPRPAQETPMGDPRDPDIVRAHRAARRAGRSRSRPAEPDAAPAPSDG
ncbi:MAG TPA: hypothetical protein VK280_17990 [Streptosporangiaceae bacterium]|nr:hypothetical protein [Streptosporangiaceae bacterium]